MLLVDCVTQINYVTSRLRYTNQINNSEQYSTFVLLFTHKRYSCLQVGLTPLHLAAESGHKELVGLLVASYKASVDAFTLVRVFIQFVSTILRPVTSA